MTLFEIGIFRNQVQVFHREFYPLHHAQKSLTTAKRANLINLIARMAEIVLEKKEVDALDNGKYRIFFAKMEPDTNKNNYFSSLFMYAIGDKQSNSEIVKPLLKDLIQQFISGFKELVSENIEDVSQYEQFTVKIQSTLADELLTPGDRVKSYLF